MAVNEHYYPIKPIGEVPVYTLNEEGHLVKRDNQNVNAHLVLWIEKSNNFERNVEVPYVIWHPQALIIEETPWMKESSVWFINLQHLIGLHNYKQNCFNAANIAKFEGSVPRIYNTYTLESVTNFRPGHDANFWLCEEEILFPPTDGIQKDRPVYLEFTLNSPDIFKWNFKYPDYMLADQSKSLNDLAQELEKINNAGQNKSFPVFTKEEMLDLELKMESIYFQQCIIDKRPKKRAKLLEIISYAEYHIQQQKSSVIPIPTFNQIRARIGEDNLTLTLRIKSNFYHSSCYKIPILRTKKVT